MTDMKGFALVVIGILIFTVTSIYVGELYEDHGTEGTTGLEARANELMKDIRESEHLTAPGEGTGSFDADKVLSLQAADLKQDDVELQLEIIDVSGYDEEYTRSLAFSNPIQTSKPPPVVGKGEMVTVHSAATVVVGPDEVHAVRLVLRVWEA